jgi:hypothetical protein
VSRVLNIADAIKTRLESRPALAGVDVIVDRQKDLSTLVAKGVGRAKGSCITILWDGFSVPDANASGPQVTSRYTLRTWSRPIINDEVPADELVEEVAKALHHWIPEGVHSFGEMTITGGDFTPDAKWLIYEVEAQVTLKL